MERNQYNELSGKLLSACIEVHKNMGPGLLESIYESCLMKELQWRGIKAESQVEIPLIYKGWNISKKYRIDILVEDAIIVEVKAVEVLSPIHAAQLISYLRLTDKRLGFLVNFNVPLLKDGFIRYVNKF